MTEKRSKFTLFLSILATGLTVIGGSLATYSIVIRLGIGLEILLSAASALLALAGGLASAQLAQALRVFQKKRNVFVSYNHQNFDAARTIAKKLGERDYRAWLDIDTSESEKFKDRNDASSVSGEKFGSIIERAIRDSDFMIVLSGNEEKSEFLDYEYSIARRSNVKIIPISIGESRLSSDENKQNSLNFPNTNEIDIDRIVKLLV